MIDQAELMNADSVRRVSKKALDQGVRFNANHINEPMEQLARFYLANYQGSFAFVLSVQRQMFQEQHGGTPLTKGQLAGVLNCMVKHFKTFHNYADRWDWDVFADEIAYEGPGRDRYGAL